MKKFHVVLSFIAAFILGVVAGVYLQRDILGARMVVAQHPPGVAGQYRCYADGSPAPADGGIGWCAPRPQKSEISI